MDITHFYLLLLCLLSFSACQSDQSETRNSNLKPNILFILADDLTYEAVVAVNDSAATTQVYEQIRTPHLDRLKSLGTTFTHTYNMGGWNGAICVASRAMLVSGRYLWQARKISQRWQEVDSASMEQSWGKLMSNAGYDTYMSGKWHVKVPADFVFGTVRHIRPGMPNDAWGKGGGGKRVNEAIREGSDVAAAMPVGYNRPQSPQDHSWDPTDTSQGGYWSGGEHWSEVLKDDALDFIDQAAEDEDPFFMYLAFNAPHDPRQSPQEYLDMYPMEEIEVVANFLPEYPDHDQIGLGPGLRDEALAPFPRTPYAVQKHRQEYYALISHLDAQIGQILDALETTGKMENTFIVFTSDHGLSVGHHGLIGKQNMYDHSMRVPFIVAGPGVPAGEVRNQHIYMQDVMPTVLEWAGTEIPGYVDFQSLTGLIADPDSESQHRTVYGAYRNIHRMIVRDGFKLIVYPAIDKTLLFDLKKDALEMNNLAGLAEYRQKETELLQELKKMEKRMDDPLVEE